MSLCDYSGRQSQPYADAGYRVIRLDPKLQWGPSTLPLTCQELASGLKAEPLKWEDHIGNVHGILMAPPCTDFSASGAQYWWAKDFDGRTKKSLQIVDACLSIKDHFQPKWWVLENPVGRLPQLRPVLGKGVFVHPHWYAGWADDPASKTEACTKLTGLWGNFNRDLPKNEMPPVKASSQGSWIQSLGGKSERTKELRSMTPQGFARAFKMANP